MSGQYVYTSEDVKRVTEYVETLPVALQQYLEEFIQLKLPLEVVKTFMETAKRARDPLWVNAQDAEIVQCMDAMKGGGLQDRGEPVGRLHTTHVSVELLESEKAALRVEYAGVTDLKFAEDGKARRVDHPYMYATRVISMAQIRRMVSAADVIVEVGAKVEHVINHGPALGKYYAIMPVLDAHDIQRHSPARKIVQLMLKRGGRTKLKENQRRVAEAFLGDFDSMFSRKKVQDVTIGCDTVISQDANYDIPMSDAVAFMHRSGAKRWLGSMVRCDDAAIFTGRLAGEVEGAQFCYEIDADKDEIMFHFKSSAFPYKHKLSVFREYQISNNREFVVQGSRYVYKQLPQTTRTQLYFAIYAIPDRAYEHVDRVYKPVATGGMLKIHHPVAVLGAVDRFVMTSFDVPQEIFSRAVRDRLNAKNDDDSEVIRDIRSARISVVVNGTRVSTDQTLAADHVKALAAVIKVYVAEMKRNGGELSSDAQQVIAAGGVVKKKIGSLMWDALCGVVAGPGSLVHAVGSRLKDMKTELSSAGIRVEEVAKYVRMPDNVVVELDEVQQVSPTLCYCAEKAYAAAVYEGEHGGLTNVEQECMGKYIKILERMHCTVCEHERHPMDRVVEEYEQRPTVEDSTDEGSVSRHDSGYASDDGSATTAVTELFEDAEEYFDCVGDVTPQMQRGEGIVRDAAVEYIDIQEQQMLSHKSEAVGWVPIVAAGGWTSENLKGYTDGRITHYALHVQGGMIVKLLGNDDVDPQDFKMVYDVGAKRWYEVKKRGRVAYVDSACGGIVYTNTNFLVWNQPMLISAMKNLLSLHNIGPMSAKLFFTNGIYGCGKTREIVNYWQDGDVYLTATARSAATVRRRLYGDSPVGKTWVRTYDSAMIHGVPETQGVLWLDEMPMAHFGQVLAMIEKVAGAGAKPVAYGDFQQIKFIPFIAAYFPKFANGRRFLEEMVIPVQHRSRTSIVAATLSLYPSSYRIAACRCCEHIQQEEVGYATQRVTSAEQIPVKAGVKYLVFTQLEKIEWQQRMSRHGIVANADDPTSTSVCSSVHEMQGETFDEVAVIRLNNQVKPGTIWFSEEHLVTALSRGRIMTKYYTLSQERDGMMIAGEHSVDEIRLQEARENSKFHFEDSKGYTKSNVREKKLRAFIGR